MPTLSPRLTSLALIVVAALAACSCSGDSSGNPSGPSGSVCRTLPTAGTLTTTSLGVTTTQQQNTTYDTAASKVTTTITNQGNVPCSTSITSYQSAADFVDEGSVIPNTFRATSVTTTNFEACGGGSQTLTYNYDSQRRITSVVNSLLGPTTYTAWDSAGRPTTGSFAGLTVVNVYNDGARTWTQTIAALASTTVFTFDASGIQVSTVTNTAGGTSTTTFSATSTTQICK